MLRIVIDETFRTSLTELNVLLHNTMFIFHYHDPRRANPQEEAQASSKPLLESK